MIAQYNVGVDWRGDGGDRKKPIITWSEQPLVIACDLCQRVTLCYLDVDDNIYHAGVGRVVRQTVLCHNKAGCAEARCLIWMPYHWNPNPAGAWLGLARATA